MRRVRRDTAVEVSQDLALASQAEGIHMQLYSERENRLFLSHFTQAIHARLRGHIHILSGLLKQSRITKLLPLGFFYLFIYLSIM